MSFQQTLWRIHRWTGLAAGLLFAVIAATGVVLIWSHELNLRGHRTLGVASGDAVDPRMTAAIADFVEAHPGGRIVAIVVPRAAPEARAWHVYLREQGADVSIIGEFDPTTAKLLGTKDADTTLQRWFVKLHYEFLAGTLGALAAWFVSVALVALALSGFWLYRSALRDLFRWRAGKTARSATGWLHRWLGVWTLALSLIWGVTGFLYLWYIVPPRFVERAKNEAPTDPSLVRRVADLPRLIERARATQPGGELSSLRFSQVAGGAPEVTFRLFHRGRWFWEKIGSVCVESGTGRVLKVRQPGDGTPRERILATVAALHFGSQGGLIQQVLWTVGGLVMVFLPTSGYALWLWRRRSRSNSVPARTVKRNTVSEIDSFSK